MARKSRDSRASQSVLSCILLVLQRYPSYLSRHCNPDIFCDEQVSEIAALHNHSSLPTERLYVLCSNTNCVPGPSWNSAETLANPNQPAPFWKVPKKAFNHEEAATLKWKSSQVRVERVQGKSMDHLEYTKPVMLFPLQSFLQCSICKHSLSPVGNQVL